MLHMGTVITQISCLRVLLIKIFYKAFYSFVISAYFIWSVSATGLLFWKCAELESFAADIDSL